MEFIKKRIYRVMTTGHTSGCTGTSCYVIIPNTGITYQLKINLVQDAQDIGFFDAYPLSGVTGTTPSFVTYNVTGNSQSRLTELRKYVVSAITSTTAQLYVTGGNLITDGVDLAHTTANKFSYFLGGIRYVDLLTGFTSGTTFRLITHGYWNSNHTLNPNFINVPMYQDPNKENIVSNPKIYDDVFIVRQEISAFDKNYRLEYIKNLVDLTTYAAGSFFNIVNNT
jgi:hypothetical protein